MNTRNAPPGGRGVAVPKGSVAVAAGPDEGKGLLVALGLDQAGVDRRREGGPRAGDARADSGCDGGGPNGERNGAYRTGRYTLEAKAERREQRAVVRQLLRLIELADE